MRTSHESTASAQKPVVIKRDSRAGDYQVALVDEKVLVACFGLVTAKAPIGFGEIQFARWQYISNVEKLNSLGRELPFANTWPLLEPEDLIDWQLPRLHDLPN